MRRVFIKVQNLTHAQGVGQSFSGQGRAKADVSKVNAHIASSARGLGCRLIVSKASLAMPSMLSGVL